MTFGKRLGKSSAGSEMDSAEPKTTTDETTLREQGSRDASVLKTAGQRRINLLWEVTQSVMGISIMAATVYAELNNIHSSVLGNAFVLIIGLYFVRTNHTKSGGVGNDDTNTR